jgi:hypothetical protein
MPVYRLDQPHVAQSLLARRAQRNAGEHRFRQMIELGDELVPGRRRQRDCLGSAILPHPHPMPRIGRGRLHPHPAAGARHAIGIVPGGIARHAIGDQPGGEAHLPVDPVLDITEPGIAAIGRFHRADRDRLLPRQIACGVEAVDADVHQRAAARQGPVEPPLAGLGMETVLGGDQRRAADETGLHQRHGMQVVRLEMAAIADHQLALRLGGRRDHRLRFGRGYRHRLLAQHMLARLERADRIFGMHAVGQHDIDQVDVGIVRDPVIVAIVVAVRPGDAILRAELLELGRRAAHQPTQLGKGAVLHARHDLVGRVIAQPHDRIAELAPALRPGRHAQRVRGEPGADAAQHRAARSDDRHWPLSAWRKPEPGAGA